jgi:mannose/fructose/N-acetylgalactosamine-specific phosphotransferase system component IIB
MTKTIQLNPEFLGGSKNTAAKTRKKEKPTSSVQPNKLRNELMKKIKDYQAKNNNENYQKEDIEDFNDEFNKSLHFLQDLTNKKSGIRNKTQKSNKSYDVAIELPVEMIETASTISNDNGPQLKPAAVAEPVVSISTHTPTPIQEHAVSISTPILIKEPVIQTPISKMQEYSSMKNGSKPTYRELKKPIIIQDKSEYIETNNHKILEKIKEDYKNANMISANGVGSSAAGANGVGSSVAGSSAAGAKGAGSSVAVSSAQDSANDSTVVASSKIDHNKIDHNKIDHNKIDHNKINKKKIKKTIRTCKYRLGKLGNKVSVLIKDYKTRKNIQNECYKLEKTSIHDIKNFLRKKNLLKVGSVAEDDVLREMYEQCILAGDIQNNNKDTLIHNFLTKV